MANTLSCPGCGLSYEKMPVHILPGSNLAPYCELCHRQLTLGAKKSCITTVINELSANGGNYQTTWAIALDEADWEHFQHWGKMLA